MSNKPSKAAIIRDLNSLCVSFSESCDRYQTLRSEHTDLNKFYRKWAITAFTTAAIKNEKMDVEALEHFSVIEVLKENYDIPKILSLKSYSWTTAFAVLRTCIRRINRLKRTFAESRSWVTKHIPGIKELDRLMVARGMDETHQKQYSALTSMKNYALSVREDSLGDLSILRSALQIPFLSGWKMSKHELLQLITLDKSRNAWDGGRNWTYLEWLEKIPEEIDSEAFERLIFLDKIEHDRDCYLFDIYMDEMMELMDRHKKETGKSLFDPFQVFEEITGKPLQTYQVHTDEYGDVVKVEQSRPNLSVIEGGALH